MDPRSWSDPVPFDYPGYDTSLSWDSNGVAHVQGSYYYRVRFLPVPLALADEISHSSFLHRSVRRFLKSRSIRPLVSLSVDPRKRSGRAKEARLPKRLTATGEKDGGGS
jgi:hypothetical protein